MIGCDREKRTCQQKCDDGREKLRRQVQKMREYGYSEEEIKKVCASTEAMLCKSDEEIFIYERLHRKEIGALHDLKPHQLITGLRIFMGVSRTRLAAGLGITRDELMRLEKNDYAGISLDTYRQIISILGLQQFPVFILGGPDAAADLRHSLQEQSKDECGTWFVGL